MQFATSKRFFFVFGVIAAAHADLGVSALAATAQWTQTGAGPFSWPDSANWSGGTVPDAATDVATFPTLSGPATQGVTLDGAGPGPITLGVLNLNSTATSYTISNGTGTGFAFDNGASAATITLPSGGLAQTINANITTSAAGLSVTNGNAIGGNALTIGGNIGGPGALTKLGTGNLILSGANTHGNTFFGPSTGTGTINAGKITLSGGNNILPTTSVVNFHPATYPVPGTNNTIYTSTLDIGSTSQTLKTIHLPGAGDVGGGPFPAIPEAPTGANVTIAGSGGTLTLNGDNLWVGITNNVNGTTPGAGVTHTVNMSTLSNFVFDNPNKEVGVHLSGNRVNAQTTIVGTLTLAPNSTINAKNLLVGDLGPAGIAGGGRSILNLGSAGGGTTILNIGPNASTGQFNVGYSTRSNADATLSGGNLTIRGFGGGSTPLPEFLIGLTANSNDPRTFTTTVNFSAGTVNALVTKMDVGTADNTAGGRGGLNVSTFTLGATSGPEDFTVGTLTIGRIFGVNATIPVQPLGATGTFTMNNAGGTLNATTINLAENTITAPGATPAKTVTGTFNLQNGKIRATTIQLGTQGGTATVGSNTKLNWSAGTIENTTGANLAINKVPITLLTTADHTFNATGSNSINQDAASPISGLTFGITKTGTGKLVLNANNGYTGTTTINGGTLLVNGTHAGGDNYTVNAGGTLGGIGTISLAATKQVIIAGGTLAPGASIESLDIGGDLLMTAGSYSWEYSGGGGLVADNALILGADYTNVTGALSIGASVALVGADLGTAVIANGVRFTLIAYGSGAPGTFAGMSDDTVVSVGGRYWKIDYNDSLPGQNGGTGNAYVTLTAVPEANSFIVLGLGGAFAAGAVWISKRLGMTKAC